MYMYMYSQYMYMYMYILTLMNDFELHVRISHQGLWALFDPTENSLKCLPYGNTKTQKYLTHVIVHVCM